MVATEEDTEIYKEAIKLKLRDNNKNNSAIQAMQNDMSIQDLFPRVSGGDPCMG